MRISASVVFCFVFTLSSPGATLPSYGFVPAPQPSNLPGTSATLADINGDGNPDIVSVSATFGKISICFGDGQGNFGPPISVPAAPGAFTVSVTDLNGDGYLDLVVHVATPTESIQTLLGNGTGSFQAAESFPIPRTGSVTDSSADNGQINPIAISDFNNDGIPDLAIVDADANAVDIRLGNGDGTFLPATSFSAGTPDTLSYLMVGDFNGDGIPDLVTATAISTPVPFPGLAVLLGNGDGTFRSAIPSPVDAVTLSGIYAVVGADVNSDGKLDLITSNSPGVFGTDCVSVYLGNGDGTFTMPVDYPCIQHTNPWPGGLVVIDVTGDGIPDIVIGNSGDSGDLQIFPGNGDGSFQTGAYYSLSTPPSTIAAADLNGDGRVDLLITMSGNTVVMDGASAPFLRGALTTNAPLLEAEEGGAFNIVISNALSAAPTSGVVAVGTFFLGTTYGIVTGISGPGWTCGLNVGGTGVFGCTRSDSLPPGQSFPAITISVSPGYPGQSVGEQLNISGGGSASTSLSELFQTLTYSQTCEYVLYSPALMTVSAGGGQLQYQVVTAGGKCPYTFAATVPWISNGIVAANQTGSPRSGVLQFTSPSGWSASITVNQLASGCSYALEPSPIVIPAVIAPESVIPFNVITSPGCSWSSSTTASWIGLSAASSATGIPSPYFTATSNPGPGYRSATVQVAGLTLNVFQEAGSFPNSVSSFAHWAVGGGWDTTIQFLNPTSAVAQVVGLGINGDMDASMLLYDPSEPFGNFGAGYFLTPNSVTELDGSGTGTPLTQTGSAIVTGDSAISGLLRFRYDPTGQEGIVPLETRNAGSYVLAFDNTNGLATGVAVANLSNAAANIPVTFWDNSGNVIVTGSVSLAANAHSSFVLSDQFSSTANTTGTLEFETPSGGRISVLGIRYPPSGQFTTIPVAASTDPGNGSMAQFATGGGWTTTVELMNTGSVTASAQLTFFGDDGSPLALPLSISGNATTAAVVNQTLAPHTRVVINSTNASSAVAQNGSARLTSDGQVSGFIRYLYGPSGEEAISPLETRNASSYVVPFDNTNGLATGIAIANLTATAATVPVVIRDPMGNALGSSSVAIPANGHIAAVLASQFPNSANQSGTVEFDTPSGGQISVLGIRFPSPSTFTTIPVAAH